MLGGDCAARPDQRQATGGSNKGQCTRRRGGQRTTVSCGDSSPTCAKKRRTRRNDFAGRDPERRAISTLCDTPAGWSEQCLATGVDRFAPRLDSRHSRETDLGDRFEVRTDGWVGDVSVSGPRCRRRRSRSGCGAGRRAFCLPAAHRSRCCRRGRPRFVFPSVRVRDCASRAPSGFVMLTTLWIMTIAAVVAMGAALVGRHDGP